MLKQQSQMKTFEGVLAGWINQITGQEGHSNPLVIH